MECLKELVGVTNDTTIPFYDDLATDVQDAIAVSKSGLYMDTLPGGVDLSTIIDKQYMGLILQQGIKARDEAAKILADELVIAIATRYQSAKPKFTGQIGRKAVSATSAVSQKYTGQRYKIIEPIAGNITVNRVEVNVSGSVGFNVIISRCDKGEIGIEEVLFTLPVVSVGNTWVPCTLPDDPIILPMQREGIAQEYFFYYDRQTAGVNPKNNDIKCGTCTGTQNIDALGDFMDYNGVSFNDPNKIHNISSNKMGNGLCVSVVVGCDNDQVICREYDKKDNVQKLMAQAERYKAGEMWIEYIFKSGYVNRMNLLNREYLWGKRDHFRVEFNKRITTIANDMMLGETACYQCKDDKVTKGLIRS